VSIRDGSVHAHFDVCVGRVTLIVLSPVFVAITADLPCSLLNLTVLCACVVVAQACDEVRHGSHRLFWCCFCADAPEKQGPVQAWGERRHVRPGGRMLFGGKDIGLVKISSSRRRCAAQVNLVQGES